MNCQPVFSKINYSQEDPLLLKAWRLLKREVIWLLEFRQALVRYRKVSINQKKTLFLSHTFSLYNAWMWFVFAWSLRGDREQLILFFRYSAVLLPRPIRSLFHALVANLPRLPRRYVYLTDSYRLRDEYLVNTGLELAVLPVPVEVPSVRSTAPSEPDRRLRISYLGAARNDKGFSELPSIVKAILRSEFSNSVEFWIQASVSGTGYLENDCRQAIEELRRIQSSQGGELVHLLTKPLDENEYKALLGRSDLVLLPYTGRSYIVQTSGILIEAAAYQVPCIVPRGTWLEDELAITGGGAVFDPDEPGSASLAALQVLRSYEMYAERAAVGAPLVAERHGHEAFGRALRHALSLPSL